jgi:hypothetical protein
MAYKLLRKTPKNVITVASMDFEVRDICCVDEDVFFIHEDGIGLIHDGKVHLDWYMGLGFLRNQELTTLNSICHNESQKSLYVVADGGAQMYRVDLQLMNFEKVISDNDVKKFRKKYLRSDNSKTYVASKRGLTVWSVQGSHRCFQMVSQKPQPLIGSGRSGFSISKPSNSRICHPTGVAIMENVFCFSDCGNGMIRGVRGKSSFSIIDGCKELKDIYYVDKRVYFLSDDTIHMLSPEGDIEHLFEVYKGEEIQSFCPANKSCIYILENDSATKTEKTKSDQST